MNLLHRFRKTADAGTPRGLWPRGVPDAIAEFTSSEQQRYERAARLWWLWRHEYLAAKAIDPRGEDLQARAHLAAFGEDAHTLETFDRFYRACLHNARTLAPADQDRTQIEPDLIRELIEDAEHGFFPVEGNRTYQIDPPSEDPRIVAAVHRVMPEQRRYGLAAAILLAGLLAIWLMLPDRPPRASVQADVVSTPPRPRPGGNSVVTSARQDAPLPESSPTPTPIDDAPPAWGSMAHDTVGNDIYERAPASLELGSVVYRVYAAEVYPGEPWQADPQPGVALWLPNTYANIVLCIPDQNVLEEVNDGDTITIRTGRSDVLRFIAKIAQRYALHQTEVFDQRHAGVTIVPCHADGNARPVVRGTYEED